MKFFVLLSLIFLPLTSFAQLPGSSGFGENGVIEITPSIPAPGESVTAKVRSSIYSDLKKSNIIWTVDGVERKREIGGTTLQFKAPQNGRTSRINATVVTESGYTYTGNMDVQTAELDLIYEANTYTPPFYQGRALYSDQASLTIAAVANLIENGVRLPKNRITYTWYKDDQKINEFSGVGRDSLQMQGSLVSRPFSISVVAESVNSNLKAKKKILVNPTNPNVVLYENNPIYGSIFEKALTGSFNFEREEVGITAVPYFFSAQDRNAGNLKYSWFENGNKISNETFGSYINYLNPERSKSGTSNIEVNVENSRNFLQSSKNSFIMNVLGIEQSDRIEATNETSPF